MKKMAYLLASLCLLLGCSQVESTIVRDAGAVGDMSLASLAFKQKVSTWPTNAAALESFALKEDLQFRNDRFQRLSFSPSGEVCVIDYIITGGRTKGHMTIGPIRTTNSEVE